MIHLFKQKSHEWLAFRKARITATEAASLVGVNSYLTANQLLKQKLSDDVDFIDNEHIWDGYIAEPGVFKALELMGWELEPLAPKGYALVMERDGLCATPDNFRWDVRGVVEAKKTLKHNFEKNWLGTCPPLRYLSQVQVQMHTSGMTKAFLVCTIFEDHIPLSIYEVEYSAAYMELLQNMREDFSYALFWRPTKTLTTHKATKDAAASLLKSTYTWNGLYRRGKRVEVEESANLEEIFNG